MSSTTPEVSTVSLLPEMPPVEHFEHPFYARVSRLWWENEDCLTFAEAVSPAIDELTPEELLALHALYLDKHPSQDEDGYIYVAWDSFPYDLTVDESGIVRGAVGHISRVRDFLKDADAHQGHYSNLAESIEEDIPYIISAAFDSWDTVGPDDIVEVLAEERYRREELAWQREQQASPNQSELELS